MKTINLFLIIIISCETKPSHSVVPYIEIKGITYPDVEFQEKEINESLHSTNLLDHAVIIFPRFIDTVIRMNDKPVTIYYNEDREWMNTNLKAYKEKVKFVSHFNIDYHSSERNIFFNGLYEEGTFLYKISYDHSDISLHKLIWAKDSLINNRTDIVKCLYLTKRYYMNGTLKEIGATTDYNIQHEGIKVGLHSKYDSIGDLKQTVFYHVNSWNKAYKIITEYDNGKIFSKVKTRNNYLNNRGGYTRNHNS